MTKGNRVTITVSFKQILSRDQKSERRFMCLKERYSTETILRCVFLMLCNLSSMKRSVSSPDEPAEYF